jgi:hypothetical protein
LLFSIVTHPFQYWWECYSLLPNPLTRGNTDVVTLQGTLDSRLSRTNKISTSYAWSFPRPGLDNDPFFNGQ